MVNKRMPAAARGLRGLLERAANLLLDCRCQLCALPCGTDNLCHTCKLLLEKQRIAKDDGCALCALPLPMANPGLYCAYCLRQRPVFQRCVAATVYSPVSAQLVNGLKHHGQLGIASTLAHEIALALQRQAAAGQTAPIGATLAGAIDVIVPVPLHWRRLRQRGYNQALQISRALSHELALPLDTQACARVKDVRAQQTLNRRQRTSNLRGAFIARIGIAGRRVAIVDDVVTTTSTANAVALSLLQAGALSCEIWCFARTPAPD